MEKETIIIERLLEKIFNCIRSDENWQSALPVSYGEKFNHDKFGEVSLTITLNISTDEFFKDKFFLSLITIAGKGKSEKWISFGEREKVISDIMTFMVDPSPVIQHLSTSYMGLLEYPRPD